MSGFCGKCKDSHMDVGLVQDIFHRINGGAVDPYFIVQMGACALAGVAHKADDIPALHLLAALDKDFVQMTVTGHPAVSMVNGHQVAQERLSGSVGNFAIGSGNDFCAGFVGNIQAGMKHPFSCERGIPVAES